jgi:hypothetical protein
LANAYPHPHYTEPTAPVITKAEEGHPQATSSGIRGKQISRGRKDLYDVDRNEGRVSVGLSGSPMPPWQPSRSKPRRFHGEWNYKIASG